MVRASTGRNRLAYSHEFGTKDETVSGGLPGLSWSGCLEMTVR